MIEDMKSDKIAAKNNLYFEYKKNIFYIQAKSIEKKIPNNC